MAEYLDREAAEVAVAEHPCREVVAAGVADQVAVEAHRLVAAAAGAFHSAQL